VLICELRIVSAISLSPRGSNEGDPSEFDDATRTDPRRPTHVENASGREGKGAGAGRGFAHEVSRYRPAEALPRSPAIDETMQRTRRPLTGYAIGAGIVLPTTTTPSCVLCIGVAAKLCIATQSGSSGLPTADIQTSQVPRLMGCGCNHCSKGWRRSAQEIVRSQGKRSRAVYSAAVFVAMDSRPEYGQFLSARRDGGTTVPGPGTLSQASGCVGVQMPDQGL